MLFKLFLFFCLLLPFQVALNPSGSFDLASSRVFILLLLFVWLAEGLKNRQLIIKNNLQTFLIASFLFLSALSISVSENQAWSVRKLLFLFSVFPIYFVAAQLINSSKRQFLSVRWLIFGGTGVACLGLIQFCLQFILGLERVYQFWAENVIGLFLGQNFSAAVLQNPSWLVNVSGQTYLRSTATFPDPHMLSFFLGMTAALSLGMFLTEKRKFFYGLSFCLMLICNFLTFSRGGYLAIVVGLVFALIFFWKKLSKNLKKMALGFFFMGMVALSLSNPILNRYSSIFDLREGSNAGRIEIWLKAWNIVQEHPFLGVGIGNYSLEIKPTADYREPFNAHNTYLDIAAETGVLNALIWIGLLLSTLIVLIKKASRQIFFLGPALAIVIFAVHSFFETALYSPIVLALFLVVVSLSSLQQDGLEDA